MRWFESLIDDTKKAATDAFDDAKKAFDNPEAALKKVSDAIDEGFDKAESFLTEQNKQIEQKQAEENKRAREAEKKRRQKISHELNFFSDEFKRKIPELNTLLKTLQTLKETCQREGLTFATDKEAEDKFVNEVLNIVSKSAPEFLEQSFNPIKTNFERNNLDQNSHFVDQAEKLCNSLTGAKDDVAMVVEALTSDRERNHYSELQHAIAKGKVHRSRLETKLKIPTLEKDVQETPNESEAFKLYRTEISKIFTLGKNLGTAYENYATCPLSDTTEREKRAATVKRLISNINGSLEKLEGLEATISESHPTLSYTDTLLKAFNEKDIGLIDVVLADINPKERAEQARKVQEKQQNPEYKAKLEKVHQARETIKKREEEAAEAKRQEQERRREEERQKEDEAAQLEKKLTNIKKEIPKLESELRELLIPIPERPSLPPETNTGLVDRDFRFRTKTETPEDRIQKTTYELTGETQYRDLLSGAKTQHLKKQEEEKQKAEQKKKEAEAPSFFSSIFSGSSKKETPKAPTSLPIPINESATKPKKSTSNSDPTKRKKDAAKTAKIESQETQQQIEAKKRAEAEEKRRQKEAEQAKLETRKTKMLETRSLPQVKSGALTNPFETPSDPDYNQFADFEQPTKPNISQGNPFTFDGESPRTKKSSPEPTPRSQQNQYKKIKKGPRTLDLFSEAEKTANPNPIKPPTSQTNEPELDIPVANLRLEEPLQLVVPKLDLPANLATENNTNPFIPVLDPTADPSSPNYVIPALVLPVALGAATGNNAGLNYKNAVLRVVVKDYDTDANRDKYSKDFYCGALFFKPQTKSQDFLRSNSRDDMVDFIHHIANNTDHLSQQEQDELIYAALVVVKEGLESETSLFTSIFELIIDDFLGGNRNPQKDNDAKAALAEFWNDTSTPPLQMNNWDVDSIIGLSTDFDF